MIVNNFIVLRCLFQLCNSMMELMNTFLRNVVLKVSGIFHFIEVRYMLTTLAILFLLFRFFGIHVAFSAYNFVHTIQF